MIQNIIALIIVFSASAISLYSLIKSLVSKKASKCEGCPGCELKKMHVVKSGAKSHVTNFSHVKLIHSSLK